jgi:hypothetical protein
MIETENQPQEFTYKNNDSYVQGDNDKTMEDFNEAIEMKPDNVDAYCNLIEYEL